MGVRTLMAALAGSEVAGMGPTDDLGRLERRVRGPRSGEGGALLRDGEARVRVAGPAAAAAAAAAVRVPVRRVTGNRLGCVDCKRGAPAPATSSVRRGRLRRRSMMVYFFWNFL